MNFFCPTCNNRRALRVCVIEDANSILLDSPILRM